MEAIANYLLGLLQEVGSSIYGFILLAKILSAQKKFVDVVIVIDAALDQSGKWGKGDFFLELKHVDNVSYS
jgi:tetratricopeptide repeat protein 7